MLNSTLAAPPAGVRIDQLSTHLSTLQSAERFFGRYGGAIRSYLTTLLRDPADAEEVMQELLFSLIRRGGADTWPGNGRFRDYLKVSARNAAVTHLRKRGREPSAADLDWCADPRSSDAAADVALRSEWQRCVLARADQKLESCERLSPGTLCHTVLRIVAEFPDESSAGHARIASERANRAISAEAFRKQVSRARRLLAEFVLNEVARGLRHPTAGDMEEELSELGLWGYVADYLPADWRARFCRS